MACCLNVQRQAIIWTNAGILWIRPWGNFHQNTIIFIQENAFQNVVRKMVAILPQPQCVNPLGPGKESVNWVIISSGSHALLHVQHQAIIWNCFVNEDPRNKPEWILNSNTTFSSENVPLKMHSAKYQPSISATGLNLHPLLYIESWRWTIWLASTEERNGNMFVFWIYFWLCMWLVSQETYLTLWDALCLLMTNHHQV